MRASIPDCSQLQIINVQMTLLGRPFALNGVWSQICSPSQEGCVWCYNNGRKAWSKGLKLIPIEDSSTNWASPEHDREQTPGCPDCACSVYKLSWDILGSTGDLIWYVGVQKYKLLYDLRAEDNLLPSFENLSWILAIWFFRFENLSTDM